MKKILKLIPLLAFATTNIFAIDNLELVRAIKQVVIESKNTNGSSLNQLPLNNQNNPQQNNPLVIPESKEEKARKKFEEDQYDTRILESKLRMEQTMPRPVGYSKIANKSYAYINFSQKIFKVTEGDSLAGFTVSKITKGFVELKTPFESNSKTIRIPYEVASVSHSGTTTSTQNNNQPR